MSYVCLLANQNGAAAAGDTRVSRNFSGEKPFKIVSDKRRKVFTSDEHKVIWVLAGVTKLWGWDYFKQLRRTMKNDSVSFEKRLEKYVSTMKRGTKWYHRFFKGNGTSTILFASYWEKEQPTIGSITIQNGEVTSDKRYRAPVFMEAGSNYARLTDRKKYRPTDEDSLVRMKMMAAKRVSEAVKTDKKLSNSDVFYRPAVGGSVLVKGIAAK